MGRDGFFKGVAKKLSLEHGCLVDRCCFEKGKDRPWKRWWFVSNSPQFIWSLSENQCDGGHSHHPMDLTSSGLYPARLGKTLVEAAVKDAGCGNLVLAQVSAQALSERVGVLV